MLFSVATRGDAQLRVRTEGAHGTWVTWWHAERAPTQWRAADPRVKGAVRWTAVAPGVEHGTLSVAGRGEAVRLRIILVRIDPRSVRISLDADTRADGSLQPWRVDATDAARSAVVAMNAGQFTDEGPWGWIVHNGRTVRPPGPGALAGGVVVQRNGRVLVVDAEQVQAMHRAGESAAITEAFQSYPTVLWADGSVPPAVNGHAPGIDRHHRDARLAMGTLRDGRVLIALTRFDALGSLLGSVPFGLTVPETAALMGALGCNRALLLDGGISAQLAVGAASHRQHWSGLRAVPLGLIIARPIARAALRHR
jgi:exopolysaccharide biosynthesis protein